MWNTANNEERQEEAELLLRQAAPFLHCLESKETKEWLRIVNVSKSLTMSPCSLPILLWEGAQRNRQHHRHKFRGCVYYSLRFQFPGNNYNLLMFPFHAWRAQCTILKMSSRMFFIRHGHNLSMLQITTSLRTGYLKSLHGRKEAKTRQA